MSASNYLPPFSARERVEMSGDDARSADAEPDGAPADAEVTYADFLGDQVDD
ncbi:hypothetical protein [Curtobacterium sp. 9128]|uniref:hypothetical protein n=1 Tax=Curtobacterium sp. 9128 TaxID=1793722 RepID=UPI0016423D80|nr:hypothetical protein [Curtobacterium sp. 9128]